MMQAPRLIPSVVRFISAISRLLTSILLYRQMDIRELILLSLAKEIINEEKDKFLKMPESEALEDWASIGLQKMLARIHQDLEMLRVKFDVWYSENSLYQEGLFDKVIGTLRNGDFITEREGATWFVSTALGDDKDNVVVRGEVLRLISLPISLTIMTSSFGENLIK